MNIETQLDKALLTKCKAIRQRMEEDGFKFPILESALGFSHVGYPMLGGQPKYAKARDVGFCIVLFMRKLGWIIGPRHPRTAAHLARFGRRYRHFNQKSYDFTEFHELQKHLLDLKRAKSISGNATLGNHVTIDFSDVHVYLHKDGTWTWDKYNRKAYAKSFITAKKCYY